MTTENPFPEEFDPLEEITSAHLRAVWQKGYDAAIEDMRYQRHGGRLASPLHPVTTHYYDDEIYQFVVTIFDQPVKEDGYSPPLHMGSPGAVAGPGSLTKVGFVRREIINAAAALRDRRNIRVSLSGRSQR